MYLRCRVTHTLWSSSPAHLRIIEFRPDEDDRPLESAPTNTWLIVYQDQPRILFPCEAVRNAHAGRKDQLDRFMNVHELIQFELPPSVGSP